MNEKEKYTRVTYATYRNHIPDGFYTIAEVENILSAMKRAHEKQKEMLNKAMQEVHNADT